MRTTVIIAVYKDVEALRLIMESLLAQSTPPDEIIITEDGDDAAMAAYTRTLPPQVKHLSQSDEGWRKNRALNRAITAATGEYLIFIDGDCVPYPSFVEAHSTLAAPQTVLCGRRAEPGAHFSKQLRQGNLSLKPFIRHYLRNFSALKRDKVRHYEQGIYLNPKGWLFPLLHRLKRKEAHIVGCNFSCFKSDLERINGFDEDFTMPTTGEDTDIERRLRHFGVKMRSVQHGANMIHLYHEKVFNPEISSKTKALMNTKLDRFVCENGLSNHRD